MKSVISVLNGVPFQNPPLWLMRQAGRYLPEYRDVRQAAGSFLDLCYSPLLACEVTLQPLRRFGFDAAILFSDILVIPDALGQKLTFEEGEGPRLDAVQDDGAFLKLRDCLDYSKIHKVYEAIDLIHSKLDPHVTLFGFCGAPWTVATYMIAGKGGDDQFAAKMLMYKNPLLFRQLIDLLVEVSAEYLIGQFKAGVDVVQIFDSWSGSLGKKDFFSWVVEPTSLIVEKVRAEIPDAKIIGFPKGCGVYLPSYISNTHVDGIGLDAQMDLDFAVQFRGSSSLQGNLDPIVLMAGGDVLRSAVDDILQRLAGVPYIFNLGHGILPQTPVSHVEDLVRFVRGA